MMPQAQTAPRSGQGAARFHRHGLTARRRGWGYHKVSPASSIPSEPAIAQRMPRGIVKRDNKGGQYVECVGPEAASKKGWKRRRRTLHIWRNVDPDGTVKLGYKCWADPAPSFREIDDYVRRHIGGPTYVPARRPTRGRDPEAIKEKRERENARRKAERAAKRKIPLQASQPWKALGISRATFYRRGLHREAVRQNLPTPITEFHRPVPLVSKHRSFSNGLCLETHSEVVNSGQRRVFSYSGRANAPKSRAPTAHGGSNFGERARPAGWQQAGGVASRIIDAWRQKNFARAGRAQAPPQVRAQSP